MLFLLRVGIRRLKETSRRAQVLRPAPCPSNRKSNPARWADLQIMVQGTRQARKPQLAVLPSGVRYFKVLPPYSGTEGEANVLDDTHTRGSLHRTGDQRLPAGRVLNSVSCWR